ncbi:H/ACA ribonucleoprotein complex subunit 3-like [Ochotona princeps]|uniref:H/ACA ribonucleoprotein complex subunit 3-like n=1 Tax=Ochotona princeps TaxID=9978 RepID=UPI0027154CD5|nr:H/ACA ribonucleoprotein complex subunit 3-like [Ochotona princeps]
MTPNCKPEEEKGRIFERYPSLLTDSHEAHEPSLTDMEMRRSWGARWSIHSPVFTFLQYYFNEDGERVYTLKKVDPLGQQTCSVHPARFSPNDNYSCHRITIKKHFKVFMTQQPLPVL